MANKIINIIVRYLTLIIISLNSLFIFYFVFTPLTVYPVYFILSLFYPVSLLENVLLINNLAISLIPACIAGSAYYLILILNLTTKMSIRKRACSLTYSFLLLLILNIIRIVVLSILFINNSFSFDIIHSISWHFLSIVFVVGIWFSSVKIYKINRIPVYDDIKKIIKLYKK